MRVSRIMGLFLGASLVSGCAMGRNQQNVARLQSQVGLLEERVSQLERGGMTGGSMPAGFSEMPPLTEPEPVISHSASKTKTKTKKKRAAQAQQSIAKPSAHASTLQPTTRDVQQALKNAGFYQAAIDGKMGNQTRTAIKEFQRVNSLKDDGVVGKQTWVKLQAYAVLSANNDELHAAEALK